jgi:hypothetical protein
VGSTVTTLWARTVAQCIVPKSRGRLPNFINYDARVHWVTVLLELRGPDAENRSGGEDLTTALRLITFGIACR